MNTQQKLAAMGRKIKTAAEGRVSVEDAVYEEHDIDHPAGQPPLGKVVMWDGDPQSGLHWVDAELAKTWQEETGELVL